MKQLYWNCAMGAAGDMLAASLLAIQDDKDAALHALNALGIPGVTYTMEQQQSGGIRGLHLHVVIGGNEELPGAFVHHHDHSHDHHAHDHAYGDHGHDHTHPTLPDLLHLISHLHASDSVKAHMRAIYALLADAESAVHGQPVELVHFHEVGALDAVADIAAVCVLLEMLGVESVAASPVHVGAGSIRCAHGILPVPTPATALLLENVPTYGGSIETELCTPTGAALLRHFAQSFGPQPQMTVARIGYGIGTKQFSEAPNCVRAMLGTAQSGPDHDEIVKLETNLDDMTAEWIAFACEELLRAGARDVFTTPVQMKKGRPGTMLTVLCAPQDREEMIRLLFCHTTTLGVREEIMTRSILRRKNDADGKIRVKRAAGYGVEKEKPEFDDLAALAREKGISLFEAKKLL
jgi:uncharacterized protein (TIGR00299 family) protein